MWLTNESTLAKTLGGLYDRAEIVMASKVPLSKHTT